ncbi:MAG: hypothetical protein Q8M11_03445 [Sulfuritalea sp.]|nr:hypothetical protein [Sulfuritalea sp.]
MTYERLTDMLAAFWEKPWSKLPKKQRQAWHEALGAIGDEDGKLWDGQYAKGRKYVAENHDIKHDPVTMDSQEGRAYADLGFWAAVARDFGTVDWDYWISLQSWTPRDAACLLTELDPREYDKAAANRNSQPVGLVSRIADIERRADRDQKVALLREHPSPWEWAVWAVANGYALPRKLIGEAQKVGAGDTAKRNKWTDVALKALWQESILPGMTQKILAEKYGVSHQSISKQLNRAAERFSKTRGKASANKKSWLS